MTGLIVPVDDIEDPRIQVFRNIRDRDIVGRGSHFIIEGEVVLRAAAISTQTEIVSVLIARNRRASLAPLLDGLPEAITVFVAAQDVLDQIAGFQLHRGILALGRRRIIHQAADLLEPLGPKALIVVLCGISNHDNMGGIFRNAAAFGADAVLVDTRSCDPLYRKSIRVSVGTALTVPFARLEPETDPVGLMHQYGIDVVALSPSGDVPLSALNISGRIAVLFGTEGPGLPNDILQKCRTVRIPMVAGFDSLNVATTSGIVMHHLAGC